jgi:outer membrane protein assembly factor BamD
MRITTRFIWLSCLVVVLVLIWPQNCPAPLIWRKGEGWTYEREGSTTANNPKDQLALAKKYQADKKYGQAVSAFRRVIAKWPTSSATQDARMGLAESLTELGYHFKAYKEYQNLIDKNPNSPYFDTAISRQFEIGNLFLAGEKLKVWRFRIFSGLSKAGDIFAQIVKNAPYSKVGPASQFRIGLVFEKEKDYLSAVHAYEKLLERYPNDPLAEDAQFQIGWAYYKEARHAEYDQNAANQSLAAFSDFLLRYSASKKAPRAEEIRAELRQDQSRGLFQIAKFYQKRKDYKAALVYYNQVIEKNPRSAWASNAQKQITQLVRLKETSNVQ